MATFTAAAADATSTYGTWMPPKCSHTPHSIRIVDFPGASTWGHSALCLSGISSKAFAHVHLYSPGGAGVGARVGKMGGIVQRAAQLVRESRMSPRIKPSSPPGSAHVFQAEELKPSSKRRASSSGPGHVQLAALKRLSHNDPDSDSELGEPSRASPARRVDVELLRSAGSANPRRYGKPMDAAQMHCLSVQIERAERVQEHRQKALRDLTGDFTIVDPLQAALAQLERNAPPPEHQPSNESDDSPQLQPSRLPEAQFLALPTLLPNAGAKTPNSGSTRSRFSDSSDGSTRRSSILTTPELTTVDFDSRSAIAADSQSEGRLDSIEATPGDEGAAESPLPHALTS